MPENNPPNNHELQDNDSKNVWMYTTKSKTLQASHANTRDYIAGVAESPDGSYILGVGFNKVKVVNDANISSPGFALIVKVDARTGKTIWTYEVQCVKDCGFESVAFTKDGGFVVGGWRRDCGTLGTDQCLMYGMKSGGFVDSGLGVVQKFSRAFAESRTRPTSQRDWEYNTGVLSELPATSYFLGSAKIVMPLEDESIMVLVSGQGSEDPNSSMNNPMKLTKNGQLVWAKENKRMQANALTVTDLGVAVVGQGELGGALDLVNPADGSILLKTDMPAPKYKNSSGDFAAASFGNFQFKDASKATAQCDSITLVECWGAATHPSDKTKVLASCGTGIEPPEGSPTDTICRSDPRTIWRSYTIEISVQSGKPSWISLDNFAFPSEGPVNPAEATVADSAGEWIAVNDKFPNRALIVGDNTGIGFFVLDTTLSNPPAPTTAAPTTAAPTTKAPTTTTKATTTQAPTTERPTTEAPTTERPTTEAPTTERPTTEAPTTQEPTTQAPTSQAPTSMAPTTEKPEDGSDGDNEGSNPDEGEGSNPDEGEGSNPDEGEGSNPDEEVGSGSGVEEVASGSVVEEVGSGSGSEEIGSGSGVEEGSGEERQLNTQILCV
jgi:hypothetical protein